MADEKQKAMDTLAAVLVLLQEGRDVDPYGDAPPPRHPLPDPAVVRDVAEAIGDLEPYRDIARGILTVLEAAGMRVLPEEDEELLARARSRLEARRMEEWNS